MSCFVWQCSLHLAALAVAFGGCGDRAARRVENFFGTHTYGIPT